MHKCAIFTMPRFIPYVPRVAIIKIIITIIIIVDIIVRIFYENLSRDML